MTKQYGNRVLFVGLAVASLATPLLSSAEATASVACPGDCGAIAEDSMLAAIIESLPDESDTEAWKAHFDDSYLDGHVIYPTDPASLDPALEVYSTPQGKWMTAAYVINYGINSSSMPVFSDGSTNLETNDRPWHGWFDYARLGKARRTLAHYNYRPRYNTGSAYGGLHTAHTKNYGLWTVREWEMIELFCPIMTNNPPVGVGHPVLRAASLVHEGQHARTYRYDGWTTPHLKCQTYDQFGDPAVKVDCDGTVPHRRHAYANKGMYRSEEYAYQAQYEFLCDLASFGRAWLPADYRVAAQRIGEDIRVNQLTGNALPACGNPFPFGRKTAEKLNCAPGLVCGCAGGMTNCSGTCVDLLSSNDNCGACGAVCDGTCANGACQQCAWGACKANADCVSGACTSTGCCSQPIT